PTLTTDINLSGGGYHSRQGFSSPTLKLTYTFRSRSPQPYSASLSSWIVNTADELIERYAGYGVGLGFGTPTARLDLKYSSYRTQWKPNTLEADRQFTQSPGLYRLRDTLDATGDFKLPLALRVSAGASFTELQMQSQRLGFQKANALAGSISSG